MAYTVVLERLKEERRKLEEAIRQLEDQKKEIDRNYEAILQEEKKIYDQLRTCRDAYQYSRLEMRLSMIANTRREWEAKKEETDRKLRGYREELAKILRRIEYLKPKTQRG